MRSEKAIAKLREGTVMYKQHMMNNIYLTNKMIILLEY